MQKIGTISTPFVCNTKSLREAMEKSKLAVETIRHRGGLYGLYYISEMKAAALRLKEAKP